MINVKDFSRVINDEELGNKIFRAINDEYNENGNAMVNMSDVITVATFCAKQIFGQLCLQLGESTFFDKIIILNASENVKTSIRTGIFYALQNID